MSGTVLPRPASVLRVARLAQPVSPGGWLSHLGAMLRAARTRRELAAMDERQLRDVGLTRAAAAEEALRAPWDIAPARHGGTRLPR
jgi:uncharacterized protein YjiS (DUF1127 family)